MSRSEHHEKDTEHHAKFQKTSVAGLHLLQRRVIQVAQITLPIHPDNPHLTTTTRHVMVGITRSKVIVG